MVDYNFIRMTAISNNGFTKLEIFVTLQQIFNMLFYNK